MSKLTRRQFMTLSAAVALYAVTPKAVLAFDDIEQLYCDPPRPFGRVIGWNQGLFRAPNHASKLEGYVGINTAIPLHYQVLGREENVLNPRWYRTDGGYVHSAWIQPVENTPNPAVITDIPESGLWAEVCMPLIRGQSAPGEAGYPQRLMYYETTYRIMGAEQDEKGDWWYALADGYTWGGFGTWVPSWAMRILMPDDLSALSPGAEKRIEIHVGQQTITCYENERIVLKSGIASGLPATATPHGDFTVQYKRPTRRMQGDDYDLLGVPFPTYINLNGVAIHGTYWHNDFVQRRSHGCVNVPSEVAKWIFRWVEPAAEYGIVTNYAENGNGTPVKVLA